MEYIYIIIENQEKNIQMEKDGMEKEKNMILKVKLNLKANI